MTTYTVATGQKEDLMLGRQGEYNVTEFVFDLSDLHDAVGDGIAVLLHYPYRGEPYIVPADQGDTGDAAEQDGTTLTWKIGQLATLYKGEGVAVVSWVTESGLKKSHRYKTKVSRSIEDSVEEITDVQQSYIDQMAALHAEIVADLRGAEGLKEEIEAAADDATARIQTAIGDADGKITDVQIAMNAADDKIDEINDAGAAAVQAAQTAANVSVVNETLVYGGAN